VVEQVKGLLEDVAQSGPREFEPGPPGVRAALAARYRVPRTLLVQ
jgi:hypothetical protein